MYSTLAEFKEYLWIADSSQDSELTMYLNSAYELLNKLLWVDSFIEWVKVENVQLITESNCWENYNIYLKNKPVQEIQEINWEYFDWDYLVTYWRKVTFADRRFIYKINKYWMITVKYKYWFSPIPTDLKLMEMMLASGMYQNKWYEWISSYKLWDEQITFGWKDKESADNLYFSFKYLYDKWKNFNLPN